MAKQKATNWRSQQRESVRERRAAGYKSFEAIPRGDFESRVREFGRLASTGIDESSPEFHRAHRRMSIAQCGNFREFADLPSDQWLMFSKFCTAAAVPGKVGLVSGPFQWVENNDDPDFIGTQLFHFLGASQSEDVLIKLEETENGYFCTWVSEKQSSGREDVPTHIAEFLITGYEDMKEEFAQDNFYPTILYVRFTPMSVLRAAEMTN